MQGLYKDLICSTCNNLKLISTKTVNTNWDIEILETMDTKETPEPVVLDTMDSMMV